jgi:hypothetical protein
MMAITFLSEQSYAGREDKSIDWVNENFMKIKNIQVRANFMRG